MKLPAPRWAASGVFCNPVKSTKLLYSSYLSLCMAFLYSSSFTPLDGGMPATAT